MSEHTATITRIGGDVTLWQDGYIDVPLPDVIHHATEALLRIAGEHPKHRYLALTITNDTLEASLDDGSSPSVFTAVYWRTT